MVKIRDVRVSRVSRNSLRCIVAYYKRTSRGNIPRLAFHYFLALVPLALNGNCINFDVQHNEAPKLIQLEVHPKLFRLAKFLFALHVSLLFGDQLPAQQGFEFPDEGVMEHELHPCAAYAHFEVRDE